MPIDPDDYRARLDSHAKAIRALRDEVKRLTALLSGATPLAPSTPTATGTYVPNPNCAMCGNSKGARQTLTCAPCSALRQSTIKTPGSDREPIMRSDCFNCGAAFKRSARFLCAPCSTSFQVWKASQ